MINLFIPGDPSTITAQQKGVFARGRNVVHYTKLSVAREERRIRRFAKLQRPPAPLEGCIEIDITFVVALTQEQAKKHADQLSNPLFVIRKPTAPDWDNWSKLLCDALSKEGFWYNDSQITDGSTHKRYGSEPRIEIVIRQVAAELP